MSLARADLSRWYIHTFVIETPALFLTQLRILQCRIAIIIDMVSHQTLHTLHTQHPGQLRVSIPCMSHVCMLEETRVHVLRCVSYY